MSNLNLLDKAVATAFYGHFRELRPAQEAAIPPLVAGQNLVLSAATGSGKTEAVMAPILSRLWRRALDDDSVSVLYIAPTKALVNDLEKRLALPCEKLGLRVGVRHGDRDDISAHRTPHVLITTPESLEVLLFRKDPSINTVQAVVIDEAHVLYNSQRGLHLSVLMRRLRLLVGSIQWAALSATLANLAYVRDFLFGADEQAAFVDAPTDRPIDARVIHTHSLQDFVQIVRALLGGEPTKLLVFANSRRECERLAGSLTTVPDLNAQIFAHYSSLSTETRLEAEAKFASATSAVCIATSTLELGIDIGDIDAVLLWGIPASVESFLQRIGRGNRRTHKVNVICFVPDDSTAPVLDAVRFVAEIGAAREGTMPSRTPYELFGAVAQQCLSIIASDGGRFTRAADLLNAVGHANYLNRSTLDSVLDELASQGYVQRHGFKNQYGADDGLHRLTDLHLIYGNFPASSQEIEVRHASKVLGHVPIANLLRLRRGGLVRFAGRRWQVEKLSPEAIVVAPTQRQGDAVDFAYGGFGVRCDTFVNDRVWSTVHNPEEGFDVMTSSTREMVHAAVTALRSVCGASQIPCFGSQNGLTYLTFGGRMVNRAVALIDGQEASEVSDVGFTVARPVKRSSFRARPEDYGDVMHLLPEPGREQTVYQALLPVRLQMQEYLQDWLKDESVADVLRRLSCSEPTTIPPEVAKPWLA